MNKNISKKTYGIEKNIWKYFALNVLSQSIVFLPIFVLFLQENGVSLTQVFVLQSIFAIVVMLFEIPSGFLGDVMGRRKCLIVSSIFTFIGFLLYSLGDTFHEFCIAESVLAIGLSFLSGTDSALLYDTLIDIGKKEKYQKYEGLAFFYGRVGALVSSIIGGYLATFYLRLPFFAMIPVSLSIIIISLSIKEPKIHEKKYDKDYVRNMVKISKFALRDNKEVKWLLIYTGVINGFGCVIFWLIQPVLESFNVPLIYFGIIFALLHIIAAITAKYAYVIDNKIGKKGSIFMLGIMTSVPLIIMGIFYSRVLMFLFLITEMAWAYHMPILKDYINRIVYSNKRATVLSFGSFFTRIVAAIFMPFAGFLGDVFSLQVALLLLGMISIFACTICLIMFKLDKVI